MDTPSKTPRKMVHTFSSVSLTVRHRPPLHLPPQLVSWFVTIRMSEQKATCNAISYLLVLGRFVSLLFGTVFII